MERNIHYLIIDFLRIFAAILVLLNHFATYAWNSASVAEGSDVAFGFLSAFAGLGAVGVEIFFVISGFVIAMSASGEGGASQALRFARIRATRILPALWLSALVSLAARAFYGEDLSHLLMDFCRSVILSPKGPYIDGVVWSLVVEAVFYLLVIVSILSRFRLSLYDLAKIIGFSSSVYLLIVSGLHLLPPSTRSEEAISMLSRFPFKLLLLQHGVFFAAGMIFSLVKNGGDDHRRMERHAWKVVLLLLFGCMSTAEIFISVERGYAYKFSAVIVWLICMCIMAAGVRHSEFIKFKLSKRHVMIKYIGGISYPIYLNHYSVGMVMVWWLFSLDFPTPVVFVLSMLFVLGLSMAVMWLEKRIQNAIRGGFPKPGAKRDQNGGLESPIGDQQTPRL
ncbi:acyltransferase [Mesorhizobium sp. YC-39]|uniref:acyltransferase family protein n=1 Tax=unclassified Mesorhizobium TaxID=325217 RepID=UPI0021E800D8|nr:MULTISPECIES: acyltransferase [unclassified Mesorhizobium]MCV3208645.1 acyltransferase [Mesorhizobium sp. YC-2]MCV3232006.1 acyltransferase [Mesorhizobium sp. YC-39]